MENVDVTINGNNAAVIINALSEKVHELESDLRSTENSRVFCMERGAKLAKALGMASMWDDIPESADDKEENDE